MTDITTVAINTGTVTIKYAENKFGSFVVTVTVSDGKPGCSPYKQRFNVIVGCKQSPLLLQNQLELQNQEPLQEPHLVQVIF